MPHAVNRFTRQRIDSGAGRKASSAGGSKGLSCNQLFQKFDGPRPVVQNMGGLGDSRARDNKGPPSAADFGSRPRIVLVAGIGQGDQGSRIKYYDRRDSGHEGFRGGIASRGAR